MCKGDRAVHLGASLCWPFGAGGSQGLEQEPGRATTCSRSDRLTVRSQRPEPCGFLEASAAGGGVRGRDLLARASSPLHRATSFTPGCLEARTGERLDPAQLPSGISYLLEKSRPQVPRGTRSWGGLRI